MNVRDTLWHAVQVMDALRPILGIPTCGVSGLGERLCTGWRVNGRWFMVDVYPGHLVYRVDESVAEIGKESNSCQLSDVVNAAKAFIGAPAT